MAEVGDGTKRTVSRGDGKGSRMERRVGLGITKDVARMRACGACIDGARVGGPVIIQREREDVLLLEVVKEMVEVGDRLTAAGEIGALIDISIKIIGARRSNTYEGLI